MNYKELSKEIHTIATEKGFWEDTSKDEKLMLIVTEISEILDADRKNRRCTLTPEVFDQIVKTYSGKSHQYDTWISFEQGFKHIFRQEIKDTLEGEFSDVFIRCLDYLYEYERDFNKIQPIDCKWSGRLSDNLFTILKKSIFDDNDVQKCACCILSLSNHMNINLDWFVKQGMKYNSTRERFHGKKY